MTGIDNAKVKWRIQVRENRKGQWKNRGLFETKTGALAQARYLREGPVGSKGFGRGNVQVIRYESKL